MRVEIIVDPEATREWHRALYLRLTERRRLSVRFRFESRGGASVGPAMRLLFLLERLLYRIPAGHPADPADLSAYPTAAPDDDAPDLVIDLVRAGGPENVPRLTLACCGSPIDIGATEAVLAHDAPVLSLDLHKNGEVRRVARWRLALERSDVALTSLDAIFGRSINVIDVALLRLGRGLPLGGAEHLSGRRVGDPADADGPIRFLAAELAFHARRWIDRHLRRATGWSVGWRTAIGESTDLPRFPEGRFRRIRTDGRRHLATPFLCTHAGRTFAFVEEFPFATGRGLIAACEFRDGRFSAPEPVLEADCHLSYPYVFAHAGHIWMVPDTSARRSVEFWAAVEFPFRWERRYRIQNVDLSHVTVLEDAGRLYLIGSTRYGDGASDRDAIAVLTADRLEGPWRPVGGPGPVLVDASAARPAGRPFRYYDGLVRPAEDNRGGLAAGLSFVDIVTLSPEHYGQRTIGAFRPAQPHKGLSHYERDERFELVCVNAPVQGRSIQLRPDFADT
ncbi:glucosamine inositolphosphorylceramide transferase family protein [Chthonobacter albigriseus]|uniref:glucosamine inositolphosphorylceramide transferase family protein n=1 Tax=Chthonobacter albigriseus TaxID=1683161 RepID=UPI0015EEB6B5|nr:hypothetical protein [Chthonobacter albigriseus]